MQPYFFPYLGYFDLINRTDRWVVFDVVDYHPKSWMNRNRILHPKEGWQYISMPVHKRVGDRAIKDVVLVDKAAAHKRIVGQIEHYRQRRAPHYSAVRDLLKACFDGLNSDLLVDLNLRTLVLTCEYLRIAFNPIVLSRSGLELPPIDNPGQWALELSSLLGAREYINPPNGRDIFEPEEFARRGIALTFTELIDFRYKTGVYDFVDHLSILDVMMWNAPEALKAYLDSRLSATPAYAPTDSGTARLAQRASITSISLA